MPSKSAGKTITKINFTKKGVSVFFSKQRISISKDAYVNSFLYVGKTLSDKEINELTKETRLNKLFSYSLSLLKKGHLSEWKLREKLYAKEASKSDVDYIIKRLKMNNLIDDHMLALDYVEYASEKNIGKNKIIQNLKEKGIFDSEIEKIHFKDSEERRKANDLLPLLEKKYQREPYNKKKSHIYQTLISRGFNESIALSTVEKIKGIDEKDESNKIKKDYEKVYRRLSSRYEDNELKEKIFKALKNKGYRYKDIQKVMEQYDY